MANLNEISKDISALSKFNVKNQWSQAINYLLGFDDKNSALNAMRNTFQLASSDKAKIKGPALKFFEAVNFLDLLLSKIKEMDDDSKSIWLDGYNKLYLDFVADAAQQGSGMVHQAQTWIDNGGGSEYEPSNKLPKVLKEEIEHLNELGSYIRDYESIPSNFNI